MKASIRAAALGFLAGVLSLLTIMIVIYLALALVALLYTDPDELVSARATGALSDDSALLSLYAARLAESVQNGLRGLWDARLAFLLYGLLGVFAAWSYHAGAAVYPRQPWLVSYAVVAILAAISAITWAFAQRAAILLWMSETPETYRWRDMLLRSYTTEVTVALIFAPALAYGLWAPWRQWYTLLRKRWMPDLAGNPQPVHAAQSASTAHHHYAERLHELKRGAQPGRTIPPAPILDSTPAPAVSWIRLWTGNAALALLAVALFISLVLYTWANRTHQNAAVRLQHGETFVDSASQPTTRIPVQIEPDVQRLRVVNINGEGAVTIYLSQNEDTTQSVAALRDWSFEWRSDEYLYQDLPVAGLPAGSYLLTFTAEDGWGYFETMLSHGGGEDSYLTAIAVGFLLACSLVLGIALSFLVIIRLRQAISE
jgi:hypothetical protein